jgi:hypothetical protein
MLEIHGDLRLKGWDDPQVVAKADSAENLTVEQSGDDVTVRCFSSCTVKVPRGATVYAEALHGSSEVKGVYGALIVQEAHGDLELRSVGPSTVNLVHGNLSARNVFGKLSLDRAEGNVSARDVHGDFSAAGQINGNLKLDDIDGSAAARANGNISVRLEPLPGKQYNFSADGDLHFRLPADISARVVIERAAHISINLKEMRVDEAAERPYQVTLGDGDAEMTLSAGGSVLLSTQAPDWELKDDFGAQFEHAFDGMAESMGESITQQIEAQVRVMEEQINAQLANLSVTLGGKGLSEEQRQRIEQRAREASERAAARAEERMRHAQEKMERKLAAAQRRVEAKSRAADSRGRRHGWSFSWPTPPAPPTPPTPPSDPVSNDERLVILRMLEEKKISLEQAEQLLAALEGKEA